MVAVELDAVSVHYEDDAAVRDVSLHVDDGDALVLLGPSGSGKTTLLRVLAGLDKPSSGRVLFDGVPITDVPPAKRNVAMVFQQEVLYPTKGVRGNIAFPLRTRRVPKDEVDRRVDAEARSLGLARLLERLPGTLSAGHRQLVQLARAMVRSPGLFIIDEPLGPLDPATRRRLRSELRLLQQGYGVTAVYATHDQEDALALGDRIAVLDAGTVRQVGTGREVYQHPANTFVARFVGVPQMAMLPATATPGGIALDGLLLAGPELPPPDVLVGVRAEAWVESPRGIAGTVQRIEDQGARAYAEIETEGGPVTMRLDEGHRVGVGDRVRVEPVRYHLFDAATGAAVYHSR